MGFELELRIGVPRGGGAIRGFWFEEFATIKLGNIGEYALNNLYLDQSKIPGWVQLTYGVDLYTTNLHPVPIKRVIEAIRADTAVLEHNQRRRWALGLLTAMEKDEIEGLSVLLYGY